MMQYVRRSLCTSSGAIKAENVRKHLDKTVEVPAESQQIAITKLIESKENDKKESKQTQKERRVKCHIFWLKMALQLN